MARLLAIRPGRSNGHAMRPLIRLENVGKVFLQAGAERVVLQALTAEVAQGEFVSIRGRSGSGKSTLLNLLAGIDLPTSGDVFVADACVNRMGAGRRSRFRRDTIGFVFQFFHLIPTLTVLENVRLPAELAGQPQKYATSASRALLDEVGLLARAAEFPDRLSGGEQQRVAIARALLRDPPLILADEPTGNLDRQSGERVMELLTRLAGGQRKTLLVVTHSRRIALQAERHLILEDGQLVPDRDLTAGTP
jgi:putative ABC transport system ATP-binding protein